MNGGGKEGARYVVPTVFTVKRWLWYAVTITPMKIQLDKRSRMTVSPGFRQISASLWETLSLYNCSILHRVQCNLRKASKNIEKMGSVAPQLNENFGGNVEYV